MYGVTISSNDLEPWVDSIPPEKEIKFFFRYPYVNEGPFHHAQYAKTFEADVASERVLLELNAYFGDCYTIAKKLRWKRGNSFIDGYRIVLRLDGQSALMMLMRFPNELKLLNLPDDFRESIRLRAQALVNSYEETEYRKSGPAGGPSEFLLEARAKRGKD